MDNGNQIRNSPLSARQMAPFFGAVLICHGNFALACLLLFGWGIRDAGNHNWGAIILAAYAFFCLAMSSSWDALKNDRLVYRITQISFASIAGILITTAVFFGLPGVVSSAWPAFFIVALLISAFEYLALTLLMLEETTG